MKYLKLLNWQPTAIIDHTKAEINKIIVVKRKFCISLDSQWNSEFFIWLEINIVGFDSLKS